MLEKDLREEFALKIKNLEDGLKKEVNYIILQNSVKKGIDETMAKRSPTFVPLPQPGLDDM